MDTDDEETLTLNRDALQADVAYLYSSAQQLFPADVRDALLARWREPHRRYHGISHLVSGLHALDELGAGRLERVAYWFHDAVHTNTTPDDEQASAQIAREWLAAHLDASDVDEVVRLVLLTTHHQPQPGDEPGWRISDADLVALAAPAETYDANTEGIRVEIPGVTAQQWAERRASFLTDFLGRFSIYGTATGQQQWEQAARANLRRELDQLQAAPDA